MIGAVGYCIFWEAARSCFLFIWVGSWYWYCIASMHSDFSVSRCIDPPFRKLLQEDLCFRIQDYLLPSLTLSCSRLPAIGAHTDLVDEIRRREQ